MSSHKKPPGHIHKVREFELEKITLSDEFDILQIVGEGWFGKILLVEHRASDTEMVLKALPKPYVSLRDFYREFHYGLHLGVHKNIVTTYDVAFETAGFYVFTQEYAPLGDLTSNVSDSGIGELHSKRVAKQIASALDYMHSKDIVHRDVKLDNVLIYKSDFSRVKLCDFGESYKSLASVERRNEWLPYSPPEVLHIQPEGVYEALPSHDVWQFAIVIFVCLTGCLPWQKAASDDPRYMRYLAWQGVNMMIPLRRTPKLFKLLSSKGSRMFRKFLEPRPDRRPKNLSELSRYLDDRWLAKGAEKDMAEYEPDELCPSMYSFHSSPEEKNRVLWSLAEQGIETTVDRKEKKNRIKNWIESSVIIEDEEEEDSGSASASPSSSVSREPVAGHISSVRAEAAESQRQKINTTIKDASQKHFDPRTGALQQGPSEMGTVFRNQSLSNLSSTATTNQSLNSSSLLTLGSRNNLILSEGQPYQSDYNLDDQLDEETEKMVNDRLKKYSSKSNNNATSAYNNRFNKMQKSNLYYTLSDPNLTDKDSSSNDNKTNHNGKLPLERTVKPLQRTKSDSLQKVMLNSGMNTVTTAISSTSNTNNNKIHSASMATINQYSINSNINNNNNTSMKYGLISAFKSIATISIPEINKDEKQRQFQGSEKNNQPSTLSNNIKDSGYGSYDRVSATNGGQNIKQNGPNIANNQMRMNNNQEHQVDRSRNAGYSYDAGGERKYDNLTPTMKDTPYDRIKINNTKK